MARPHEALSSVYHSDRAPDTRGAISPARSPRVPPLTMLGPCAPHHRDAGAPNIVKNGTPQIVSITGLEVQTVCRELVTAASRPGGSETCEFLARAPQSLGSRPVSRLSRRLDPSTLLVVAPTGTLYLA
jgi:hypothetical protein